MASITQEMSRKFDLLYAGCDTFQASVDTAVAVGKKFGDCSDCGNSCHESFIEVNGLLRSTNLNKISCKNIES